MNDILHEHEEGHEDQAHMPLEEEHPLWARERIELKSVGIDIGSSTSHLMFSRLVLRRLGVALSSKFVVVKREITYESPILLTPFLPGNIIDTQGLAEFIARAYAQAGLTPEHIDTGAVIITGDAARKDNAEAIASLFSQQAGKFVCATAGPNLEAQMAVCGSGTVEHTTESEQEDLTGMNVDVGGGTAKVGIAHQGAIVETAAMNVGARLVVLDEHGCLAKIEEAGRLVAEDTGINLKVGQVVSLESQREMSRRLADALFNVLARKPLSPLTQRLMITPPLSYPGKIDFMTFSGGVSEYVYGRESQSYGDLGIMLAEELRQRALGFPIPTRQPAQGIRATVIGASQYTVQVSGNTIFISDAGLLPMRNLPVLTPRWGDGALTPQEVARAFAEAFHRYDLQEGEQMVALALHWTWGPAYPQLQAFGQGLLSALSTTITRGLPIILVFDTDLGKLMGNHLAQHLPTGFPLISLDGVELQDFDYVDIGQELSEAQAVPVVIKSLVFRC